MQVKLVILVAALATASSQAMGEGGFGTERENWSYAIGARIGLDMMQRGIDLDAKAFAQAIEDIQAGRALRLSDREMNDALRALQAGQADRLQAMARRNKEAGEKFLAENKTKPGIKTTPSGVQYAVIQAGSGERPTLNDTVVVHYKGTLINGKEFDSSYSRGEPATFPVNGVIQGWQEVLQKMKVGAKWRAYIPASLAYGEHGAPPSIGPNETLIFDIELLDIK